MPSMQNSKYPESCRCGSSRSGRTLRAILRVTFILLIVPSVMQATPLSLGDACQYARTHDAQLRSAEADVSISNEEVGKAVSAFKPSIRASVSRGRNRTESITSYSPKGYETFYNTLSNSVSIRQELFNMQDIFAYRQSKAVRAKSESLLNGERTGVMVRTAEVFFNVLYAQDNVEFTESQRRATAEQLAQARRRYRDGFGTITEINEAQASYDMAIAEEASGVTGLDFARRELERITGVSADELCRLKPERMHPEPLMPDNVNDWINTAIEGNAKILAARQDIQIARREIDKSRASRLPTVELVAGRSYSVSETNYTIGSIYDTWSISLQVNVPIYSGGYTSAAVRQSVARRIKADDQYDLTERTVASEVRKYYNGVLNGMVQVRAYEQAVRSNEIALEGTRKGFGAGIRSNVDVLNAQQKMFDSRRNLAKARYLYILNRLLLKDAVGILTDDDIAEVNRWFSNSRL